MSMQQIEKARQLLPWYITGKLSSPEAKLVKEALSSSPSLHEEYEIQRKLSQMLKKDPQLMEISVISTQEQRMGVLMQRIRAEKSTVTPPPVVESSSFFTQKLEDFKQHLQEYSRFSTKQWAFAAVASIVFIQVAVFSLFLNQESAPSTSYGLASDSSVTPLSMPSTISSPLSKVKSILVIFSPVATIDEKRQILQTIDGQIIKPEKGSPSYTLVFSQPMIKKQADALILKMQNNTLVQFAELGSNDK